MKYNPHFLSHFDGFFAPFSHPNPLFRPYPSYNLKPPAC